MLPRLKQFAKRVQQELNLYRQIIADPRTPWLAKALLGLAVGYLLLPFDLLPDFIPIIGQLDDLLIVPALVWLALRMIPNEIIMKHKEVDMTEQIITLDSLAYAEIKTIQNANELVEEAKLLFENKKYSRTWALSHLAIEEISKTVVFLFAGVTICNGIELKWKELDRFLRSHQSKLKTYFMLNEEFNDFSGMIDNVNALNKLKNRSFYVDLIDDKMYKPSDFFDKGQAKIIINVAKRYLESHQKDIGYKGQIKDNHQKEIVKHYWNMHKRMTVKEVGEINYIAVIDEIIKDGKTYNKFKEIIKYMGD